MSPPSPPSRPESPIQSIKKIENKLQKFSEKMQVFTNGTVSDTSEFSAAEAPLTKELGSLEGDIDKLTFFIKTVVERFDFAKRKFEIMADFSKDLRALKSFHQPGLNLVCSVKDLNLRLLQLRDLRGMPDPNIGKYSDKVAAKIARLNFLYELAERFTDMTDEAKAVFEEQSSQAIASFTELKQYVSEDTAPLS